MFPCFPAKSLRNVTKSAAAYISSRKVVETQSVLKRREEIVGKRRQASSVAVASLRESLFLFQHTLPGKFAGWYCHKDNILRGWSGPNDP